MDLPATRVAYEFGEFCLDATQRMLRSRTDGEPIPLTSKAFETLLYLVEHPDELVDKTTLMKAVWPGVVVEENNLNQSISALRRALGESALEHRFIVTVPGRGYRFVAPVRTLTSLSAPSTKSTAPNADVQSTPAESFSVSALGKSAQWLAPRRIAFLAGAAVLAVGLIWLLLRTLEERGQPEATSSAKVAPPGPAFVVAGRLRLAVLPFENLSPDPANAFFTDGLHEEILSTLARRAPGLEVISRTTMMGYRLKPKPVQEVAKELGATHVIEGSVRREQNQVRVTLQLIDARNDRHLWSQNYDRTLSDALRLQSDVANEVASQLSVQLTSGQSTGAPTSSPEAYDLYLKALLARQFVSPFAPAERYLDIDRLLSRAIELDPSFAYAYAQRATFRGAMFAFNYDVSEGLVRRIREDVQSANRLAPNDPLALASEALFWTWVERDLPRALSTYEAAEAAGLADSMFLLGKAPLLARMHRVDECARLLERLMAMDPGNPFLLSSTASTFVAIGRLEEAMRMIRRGLEQFPDDPVLPLLRAQVLFSAAGRSDEWRTLLDRIPQGSRDTALLDNYFTLLRVEHRYAELQKLVDELPADSVREIAGAAGSGYFGVGDKPIALYRGWVALLRDDRAASGRAGQAVLDFVARREETPRNAWYMRSLLAQGYVFLGERERAITFAREALDLMPPSRDGFTWVTLASTMAGVYAWAGAGDEATALLENLATVEPGAYPADITRDPFYNVPLANNSRYRALADRLEAQIAATKL
jgi:TolB-like protein/DNA-binding winged helix-turn-helix (wHTH) protein